MREREENVHKMIVRKCFVFISSDVRERDSWYASARETVLYLRMWVYVVWITYYLCHGACAQKMNEVCMMASRKTHNRPKNNETLPRHLCKTCVCECVSVAVTICCADAAMFTKMWTKLHILCESNMISSVCGRKLFNLCELEIF